MKKSDKSILMIIILLLVIFIPASILSIYLKFNYTPESPEDEPLVITNGEKYADGKLNFYNSKNELLGQYTCKVAPCSYAKNFIDDSNYSIDYLQTTESESQIYNNRYVFISDNNLVYLYDIVDAKIVGTYKNIKNYNNMLGQNYMIVQSLENKWGVISIEQEITTVIKIDYDFVGLANILDESGQLSSSYFIVKENNQWAIIDNEGDLMSNYLSYDIVSYNDLVISVKSGDTYYLYDYNGKRVVNELGFNYISFLNNYINIVDKNNNLYVYDYLNAQMISEMFTLNTTDYKNAFTSSYDEATNSINLTVNQENYTYSF